MIGQNKILIVEDEFITAEDIRMSLESMNFSVCGPAKTGEQAIRLAQSENPDLVLMDINLRGKMNGIEAASRIRESCDIPVVYLTGQSDDATINKAIQSEPFGYVIKPFNEQSLKTIITMALFKHGLEQKLRISEARYRAIAESVDEFILLIQSDETVEYGNKYMSDLFHIPPDAVTGKNLSELLPESVYETVHLACEDVFRNRIPIRLKDKFETPEGERWLDTSYIPLFNESGEINEIFMLCRDVTIQTLIEMDLEKRGIIQIEKNMEQFQILNDQIRNPLTVLSMLASLVDNGKVQDDILNQVGIIDDLITRLDKGWIESEKVRKFLLRHYQYGNH